MSDATTSTPALPPAPLRNGRSSGMPVFLLALILAGGAHLGLLVLFHFKVDPPAPKTARLTAPAIQFNPGSPALSALLAQVQFSPEQIFLDSDKSFSAQTPSRLNLPSHPVFKPFPVDPKPEEVDFHQPGRTAPLAGGPADALKPTDGDLINSFGRAPMPGAKLAARGAFVRITRLLSPGQTGGAVVEFEWPANLAPPASNWQPVSFLLQFNATGLAGEPVPEPGFDALGPGNTPNDADVNKFLREKLRDWYTQPQHPPLPPGLYNAVVGP